MSKILRNILISSVTQRTVIRNCSKQTSNIPVGNETKKPNVDINDVKLHAESSKSWWDVNGPMKGLHRLNKLRVPLVRDGLMNMGHKPQKASRPLEGIKILDVACGGGILSEPLARLGGSVTGIDAAAELIEVAKEHASYDPDVSNINYVNGLVEDFAEKHKNEFDCVVAAECIEHILDKKSFLKACTDLLKPGGSIFVTTLNKTALSYVGAILVAENLLSIVPKGTHNWNQFITPEECRRILNEYNCDTQLIHGMFYDIVRSEWYWTIPTHLHYALHAVKSKTTKED